MKHSAVNYALWLLGRRDRSIGEIEKKLKEKEYSSEETTKTIQFLSQKKFLDDERFSQNYIKNQLIMKPQGKFQLKVKLKKKFVPDDIINKTLEEMSEDDERVQVKQAAIKWLRKYTDNSIQTTDNKTREKLCRHLASRGFGWDLIKEFLENP